MKIQRLLLSSSLLSFLFLISCEKDEHVPPLIEFKTGGSYTSANATVAKGASITVGIVGTKREDEMKTYNISYAFDGATTTTTAQIFTLVSSEYERYEKDYTFNVRNVAGVEKWYFVITDRDGNMAKLTLELTVN